MGIVASLMSQTFPPKSKFSTSNIPDLSGKIVIVTGGNAGIGKETVKVLFMHNAKVYLAARSSRKAQAAIDELKRITGKEAIFLELDLASLDGVKKSANHFLSLESELHILFNNAGVMWPPIDQLSEDGYDLQFGVHVVGHHLFTRLLMPVLIAGARTNPDGKARILTTSSAGAYAGTLLLDTVLDGPARRSKTTEALYFQSKIAQILWALELNRRYRNIQTELQRHVKDTLTNRCLSSMLYPVEFGALTQLWGGSSPDIVDGDGKFLVPWARFGPLPMAAGDVQAAEKLWAWLEAEVVNKI